MYTRREFLGSAMAMGLIAMTSNRTCRAQDLSFESLLQAAAQDTDALDASREVREGLLSQRSSRAITPNLPASSRAISEDAMKLIVLFEVTSQTRYEQQFQRPIWPHGASGVTIGIGYDAGYVNESWLRSDWKDYLSEQELSLLAPACGLTGEDARDALPRFQTVAVPWDNANPQFRKQVLPRYIAQTLKSLPKAATLSDDALGALVSLVYNRGASFRKQGDRYKEMRKIHELIGSGKPEEVPEQIRAMKRLWAGQPKLRGLLIRRDLEAKLFERGLTA
ncbi:hypothetical protein [Lysobacter sp. Hz 25]|uniref:hypothetical protein n=1 Tax=Lysobacter sp. Hz 25 TaxID=3383698 RepID=UPI0038D4B135